LGVIDLAVAFVKALLSPVALSNGAKPGVECTGGGLPANFLVDVGAGGGSATVTIEESADGATNWTPLNDYTGAQVTFSLVAANVNTSQIKTGFRTQPFVRAVVASTSGSIIAGVNLIEGNVFAAPAGEQGGFATNYDAN
jgi:hypothetical protein